MFIEFVLLPVTVVLKPTATIFCLDPPGEPATVPVPSDTELAPLAVAPLPIAKLDLVAEELIPITIPLLDVVISLPIANPLPLPDCETFLPIATPP